MQIQFTTKDVQRFWSKVDKSGDCWIWTGGTATNGYGKFGVQGHKISTHRFAYLLTYGSIPDGKYVCHHCDHRPCCRPDHLFAGTTQDNTADRVHKGRSACGDRSYLHNHPEAVRGTRNGRAKLTEEQVSLIRQLHKNGLSMSQLAGMFGVWKGHIHRIIHYKAWPQEGILQASM